MNNRLLAISAMMLACTVCTGALANDEGEQRGAQYHEQHAQNECRTVPRFADKTTQIAPGTDDPEKQTVGYSVTGFDTICGR